MQTLIPLPTPTPCSGRKDTDKGWLCSLVHVQLSSNTLLVCTLLLGLIKTPSPQYSYKLLVHH